VHPVPQHSVMFLDGSADMGGTDRQMKRGRQQAHPGNRYHWAPNPMTFRQCGQKKTNPRPIPKLRVAMWANGHEVLTPYDGARRGCLSTHRYSWLAGSRSHRLTRRVPRSRALQQEHRAHRCRYGRGGSGSRLSLVGVWLRGFGSPGPPRDCPAAPMWRLLAADGLEVKGDIGGDALFPRN